MGPGSVVGAGIFMALMDSMKYRARTQVHSPLKSDCAAEAWSLGAECVSSLFIPILLKEPTCNETFLKDRQQLVF